MQPIKVKRLRETAKLPTHATPGAACFDLYAADVDGLNNIGKHVDYGFQVTCGTALAFEIPTDHVMLVFSRSGHGFKNDVRLANCVGVIDSDYRGELKVKLTSDDSCEHEKPPLYVAPGDRIAQAMIILVERVQFLEVEELSTTERGEGGFGSTGSK